MNTAPLFFALLVAALALAPCGAHAAGKPATGKPAAPVQDAPPPRSIFVIDGQVGRDPFFPRSIRNQGRITVKTNEPVATVSSQFPDEIRVQGFSNKRDQIIVIVNGKSITKGEKIEVSVRGQRVHVHCLDVTEKTILLEVNGITKELSLPVVAPIQPQ
jgi:hypothetical protein